MRIQKLDIETSNRIAAGEVVDRPASVIKELCENSLDAGATAITVEIENGGLSLMRVVDNGGGIQAEDVEMAFERHATSKIQSGDSLMGIETLGFRGEALSSIAAVSQVVLITRTRSAQTGRRVEISGGQVLSHLPNGCPEGTSISVSNLFFNTPARLKFTKSAAAETAQISDVLLRIMLANPDVAFRFINQKKVVMQTPGTGLSDAILAIYGTDINDKLIPVEEGEDIGLVGFIGKPELSRQTRAAQTLVLNGRFIRNNALSDAVAQGYGQRMMIGRFPFFVLHLRMPFAVVDVNVHPQKLQVRFTDEQELAKLVTKHIQQAWKQYQQATMAANIEPAKIASPDIEEIAEPHELQAIFPEPVMPTLQRSIETMIASEPFLKIGNASVLKEPTGIDLPVSVNDKVEEVQQQVRWEAEYKSLDKDSKPIGQLFDTYLLVECSDCLMIIDQHAAHERLQYDALCAAYENGSVVSQMLLRPAFVELTYREMAVFDQMKDSFSALGFEIEEFGERGLVIRALPVLMEEKSVPSMLAEALDLAETGSLVSSLSLQRERIIRYACRHSIKAGDSLTQAEIEAITKRLLEKRTSPARTAAQSPYAYGKGIWRKGLSESYERSTVHRRRGAYGIGKIRIGHRIGQGIAGGDRERGRDAGL